MLRYPHGVLIPPLFRLLAPLLLLPFFVQAQDLDDKLIDAARSRDITEVRKLLAQGAHANARNRNGRTPLMEAASEGLTDTVRVLLENGADPNAKDNVGWTAIFWAAFSRRVETLRVLASKHADVNAKDGEGRTALFWASSSGYGDVVRALIEKGAHVNSRDNYGWTALMSAVDLGQLETVKVLLEKGADVQVRSNDGSTALRLAEKYKYDNIVVLLRDASRVSPDKTPSGPKGSAGPSAAAVNSSSPAKPDGSKPTKPSSSVSPQSGAASPSQSDALNLRLLQAAEVGDTSDVLSLIRGGAGVNARGATYGNTALMEAASRGHADTVRALLEKGGEVDLVDNAGRTALMEAAFEGYTDTVRILLDKGANVNAHDHEGWTPLFWAAFSRRTDTVRFLLEKGADVNAKNKYEDTPLIHAAYGGDTGTVVVLLENHADINAKDDLGRTALIEATRQGHVDTVRALLQGGALVDVQAKDGNTALAFAEKLHYTEIAALLKSPPVSSGTKAPESKPPQAKRPDVATTADTPPVALSSPTSKPPESPLPAPPVSDPLAAATQAIQKKTRAQTFYRLGLSMRIVEDFWLKNGRTAERAAASILGDLTKVGAPDDLISLAQQTSTHLAVPPEERKSTIPAQISDLRNRLNAYSLGQQGHPFFYNAGGLTYDMDLLGQDASKQDHVEAKVEDTRKAILPMATNLATQCATLTECKVRALSYISDAAGLLQQSPFLPTDGEALQRLCDQIGIALGTDEPLTSR